MKMCVKVRTNYQYRVLLSWYDLTEKEQRELELYNCINHRDDNFIRYHGQVYAIGEFVRLTLKVNQIDTYGIEKEYQWDGGLATDAFSGLFIKLNEDNSGCIIAYYWS